MHTTKGHKLSELPQIDPLKVAHKDIIKLEAEVKASRNRESQLETLAEALRDQRDEFEKQLAEARAERTEPVADISSLP